MQYPALLLDRSMISFLIQIKTIFILVIHFYRHSRWDCFRHSKSDKDIFRVGWLIYENSFIQLLDLDFSEMNRVDPL